MSYTVETYLGVAILIPTNIEEEKLEMLMDMEDIEYFPRREEDTDFWYFIPCTEESEGFICRWTEDDDNESVILDSLSPKGEISKFKQQNKELLLEVKNIAPDFQISFAFLTGGS